MSEQYNNGFCPQCGALMRDGVCPCCQYGAGISKSNSDTGSGNSDPYGNPYNYTNPAPSQGGYENSAYNTAQNIFGNNYSYQNYSGASDITGNNKSYKTTAAIVGVCLTVFSVAVIAAVSVFAYKYREENDYVDNNWDYDWDDEDSQNDYDWDAYDEWQDDTYDYDYDYNYADTIADEIDWKDKSWKQEPENCKPDELWDSEHRYYEEFKNCIHKDVDYKIKFKTEEQLDKNRNVCMRVTYYQLEGDIPNLKEINKRLRDEACYYLDYYNDETEFFEDMFDDYGEAYIVSATSYLTYHDDSMLSVAINNQYKSAFASGIELDCINIDLESGMILDNTEIIDPTKKFVETVIDHSTIQNGSNDFLDETDTRDLQNMFEDENSLIIFYTPCGLEVGLNYTYNYSYGWITTTLTDYEEYLKSY